MHTFRAATIDDWREFLGVTTRRHTKAHNISVKVAAKDHPVMKGFKEDWVTPVDELYVIEKFWPNSTALATAVSPEDQKEYPLAWVSDTAARECSVRPSDTATIRGTIPYSRICWRARSSGRSRRSSAFRSAEAHRAKADTTNMRLAHSGRHRRRRARRD